MPRILFIIFAFISSTLLAEEYYPTYSSIGEALAHRDSCYALSLVDADLTELPEQIGELKNLRMLQVNFNRLESIPESIGNCTLLEELYLNNNLLTALPGSLSELKNLRILTLDNNRFTELPAWITQFDSMSFFTINHNPLKKWPAQIGSMKFTFGDSTWNDSHTKVAFVGRSGGVYMNADSFYISRQVIMLYDNKTGNTDTLVKSSGPAEDPKNTLYDFAYMQFSLDDKYLFYVCANAWEKCDALHRVKIKNKKEEFVTDILGEYLFVKSGKYKGNVLVWRYYYAGEGTGSEPWIMSLSGKEIKLLSKEEDEAIKVDLMMR